MLSIKLFLIILIVDLNFAYGNIEKLLKCYQCSGETTKCAQEPEKVNSFECNSNSGKCYIWNNDYGLTQRGCTDSLHIKCENNTECVTCDSDLCNVEIFPPDRLRCYHCSGEECRNLANNRILPCTMYKNSGDNQCYTFVEYGSILKRGCVNDFYFCNTKNCHKCNGANCNNKDINEIEISTIGPITTDNPAETTTANNSTTFPRTCYQCHSDIDNFCSESPKEVNPKKCAHEVEHTRDVGCYVKKLDNIVFRGCLIDLDETSRKNCQDIGFESCYACYQNACNIDTIKCYHCQSDINLDCFENVENIENSNIDCFSDCAIGFVGEILYRNCRLSFDNENIENFEICNTTLCNSQPVKMTSTTEEENIPKNIQVLEEPQIEMEKPKIKCYKCEGQDESCLIITRESELVDCTHDGCYTMKSANTLKRGCALDLTPVEHENCTRMNSCTLCTESKCNAELWSKCYSCRSSEDANCAQWKHPENCQVEVCDNPNDNCIIEIQTEIETVRKCSSNNYKCTNNEICETCSGNLCNSGIFPKNRLLCHQCSLTKECGTEQLPENMEICINYNKNDGCYMFATNEPSFEALMHRGCKSDIIEYSECQKSEADKKCLTCDNENGCNSQGARTKPKLWCSICGVNEECAWSQPANTIKKCIQDYWYTLKEKCFTYLNDNGTAERGCLFDRGVCIDDARRCKTCSKSGCNFGSALSQSCIQCNSNRTNEIQCKKDLKGILGMTCKKKELMYHNIGCYTKINTQNVIRGCVADLVPEDLEKCKRSKSCFVCMEQNCNTKPFYSKGPIIKSILENYMFIVVLVVVPRVLNKYL